MAVLKQGVAANTNHIRRRGPRLDPKKQAMVRAYLEMAERWRRKQRGPNDAA